MQKENVLTINFNEVNAIDSREVAEMMEKKHGAVMRMINGSKDGKDIGIKPVLLKANFVLSEYFIESSYKDGSGKENKCYLVTKMGCEMLGNKLQGEKGILFTASYVRRFNEMIEQNKQLKSDNKELYKVATSDEDLEQRQYEADRVKYAINNIESLLLECDYTNIVAMVDKIVEVHSNLYVKDRYKAHQNTEKYGYKGDDLYVNHVKRLIVEKLDKIRPTKVLEDCNINSIIADKTRVLEQEICKSENISDGKIKAGMTKEIKSLDEINDRLIDKVIQLRNKAI